MGRFFITVSKYTKRIQKRTKKGIPIGRFTGAILIRYIANLLSRQAVLTSSEQVAARGHRGGNFTFGILAKSPSIYLR